MNKDDFKRVLGRLKTATSVTGKKYREITLQGEKISFKREGKNTPESISVNELFSFYSGGENINTTNAKSYISGRVQSPAVAILNSIRKEPAFITSNSYQLNPPEEVKSKKTNDEGKFFEVFSDVVGIQNLYSKSIGKPITKEHVFLSNNYLDYGFPKEVKNAYEVILKSLNSNFSFSSDSLSHHVDGLVKQHPTLGKRIVEFDEEQHFTPARKDTLEIIQEITYNSYVRPFLNICNDLEYLNNEVLRKHRLKRRLDNIPENFKAFILWLESSGEKESGYIKSKNGFDFLGGRLAQRAYYDCLRDTAHISDKNKGFSPPLRFAKKTFEDEEGMKFKFIPDNKLKELLISQLKNIYKIEII